MIDALVERITDLAEQLADLRARQERMFRPGKVTDVDPKKQLYRQEVGVDANGQPVKSAWLPYAQWAGARKDHTPPSVGQQMMLVSPDGDPAQAVGYPYHWSDDNPSPSDKGDEDVSARGKTKDTFKDDRRILEVDQTRFDMQGDSASLQSERVTIKASRIDLNPE